MDALVDKRAIALVERALCQPENRRERYISQTAGEDTTLRDRCLTLLSRVDEASGYLATGGAPPGEVVTAPEGRIGSYRVVRLIGQGGMGAVFLAERDVGDFAHQVAIKLVRPGSLKEKLKERFESERRVLAGLSHPNIARLFDGGATEDGSPYIVMEYVEGEPLSRWLEGANPSLDERLILFERICAAVGFLHQNLIVHRDLTLGNVLVETSGNPKLIDFGIARIVENDASPAPAFETVDGLSLTPGFAAPERYTGDVSTTLGDIYSLGRLLEAMVGPEGKAVELDAIVAKATASEATDRYSTAEALAHDVELYRKGFPVTARITSRHEVARKFVQRNKVAVLLSAAGLALLLGALILATSAYLRAEKSREEAETRFAQTRAIAKTMLFNAYDEVDKVAGSTEARAVLAESGLEYLDALASDPNAPLDVRIEAGRGYTRLAMVIGSTTGGSLGRFSDASMFFQKAQAILRPLHESNPESVPVQIAYADLLARQAGHALYSDGEYERGQALARQAIGLIEPHAAESPETARIYASALREYGDSYGWQGEFLAAEEQYTRAEAFMAALPASLDPAGGEIRLLRATNLRMLAEAYQYTERQQQAIEVLQQAIAINDALVEENPADPKRVRGLAVALWYLATVARSIEENNLARSSVDRAIDLVAQLRDRNPADAELIHLYSAVAEIKSQILADQGEFRLSYSLGDEIVELNEEKIRLADNAPLARRALAVFLMSFGTNHDKGGDYRGACNRWGRASSILRELEREKKLSEFDRRNIDEAAILIKQRCNPTNAAPTLE